MDTNSDDDALELPKPKNNKETIDALKSVKKEKQALPKRPQSEAQKVQFAAAKAVRDENRRLRAEAKELLLKDKQSKAYLNEKKKGFKAKEMEELKLLLGKNKEEEIKEVAEPKQTNKTKKATERKKVVEESESEEEFKPETESESEEEVVIVKKKPKTKTKLKEKKKKKVTIYMSSSDDDVSSSDSDYNPPAQQQKSRISRPNQVQPVVPSVDYKSYFV